MVPGWHFCSQSSTGNSSQVRALSVEPRVRLGGLGGFNDYVCVFALLQLPRIAQIRTAPCFLLLVCCVRVLSLKKLLCRKSPRYGDGFVVLFVSAVRV